MLIEQSVRITHANLAKVPDAIKRVVASGGGVFNGEDEGKGGSKDKAEKRGKAGLEICEIDKIIS